jgi:hypothetical protein
MPVMLLTVLQLCSAVGRMRLLRERTNAHIRLLPGRPVCVALAQITNAANWLFYMGDAAAALDLTVQYCEHLLCPCASPLLVLRYRARCCGC